MQSIRTDRIKGWESDLLGESAEPGVLKVIRVQQVALVLILVFVLIQDVLILILILILIQDVLILQIILVFVRL